VSTSHSYQTHFHALAAHLLSALLNDERSTISYQAETSFFMRFNQARVRQTGRVEQSSLQVKLFKGRKTWTFSLQLSGSMPQDLVRITEALTQARMTLPLLPDDPYQTVPEATETSSHEFAGSLLPEDEIPARILDPAQGMDLTGIFTQGVICRGTATSSGARHWFATHTFLVDYSAWLPNGKGVKSSYAGRHWSSQDYAKRLAASRRDLEHLSRPETILQPGSYRVFVTADALKELVVFFSWNGLSEREIQQGDSAYLALREGRESFSGRFSLSQDFRLGLEPAFNEAGETAPQVLPLIERGQLVNTLVSARTARQYDRTSNAATDDEGVRSAVIAAGNLAEADALKTLGTGIYISNFHYLNWSDPATARITGMTRFACLWVEEGSIRGPIRDMRWDESLYAMLGSKLEAVTRERHLLVETSTYEMRAVGGSLLPGILVNGLTVTL